MWPYVLWPELAQYEDIGNYADILRFRYIFTNTAPIHKHKYTNTHTCTCRSIQWHKKGVILPRGLGLIATSVQ